MVELRIWVEATAPVTTRERAKRRAMSFMVEPFWVRLLEYFANLLLLNLMS